MADQDEVAAVSHESDQEDELHPSVPKPEDQQTDLDREPTMHRVAEQHGFKEPIPMGSPFFRMARKEMDNHALSIVEMTEQVLGERIRLQVPGQEVGKNMPAIPLHECNEYKPKPILARIVVELYVEQESAESISLPIFRQFMNSPGIHYEGTLQPCSCECSSEGHACHESHGQEWTYEARGNEKH